MDNLNRSIVVVGIVLYKPHLLELEKCLESLKNQMGEQATILLAIRDNEQGANEVSVREILRREGLIETLVLWENGENVGFGSAHNALFRQLVTVPFDYYLCVNPDGVLHFDCISNLLQFAKAKGDAGIFEARQFPLEHPKPYDPDTGETDWCSGCVLLIPRTIYQKSGGFDENLFLYCEDVDFSWAVELLGYRCYMVPNALVAHYVFGDERNKDNEYKNMLISGYKLAHKYHNVHFKREMLETMMRTLPLEEIELAISHLPKPISLVQAKRFDQRFKHGFYFSAGRW